ncbi:MAG: hypothetical protein WCR58_03670 [Bacteroidales bacterium]|jgi:hypothetical protein|nr:hypothetical protein [Bacteroidales bacterium]MCK9448932.1 hypothetical protein [Bacteroidales bacterium]MDD3701095.1 hypothetical protein [Bacteroidales bacterium]MDY0368542.1 hypothetical protein [Bacteroidales bacterium]
MKVNESYTEKEIMDFGLEAYPVKDIKAKVFKNGHKVYFFELIDDQPIYRLYSIINKRSFYL